MRIIILLLLLIPSYANAEYRFAENWTREDTARQASFIIVTTADWLQTRCIAKHPDSWRELNPIIGSHPSVDKVDAYFATAIAAHTLIAVALPAEYRKWWQYTWISLESATVVWNMSAGVKWEF